MPFARPTLTALRAQIIADILPAAGNLLSRAVLRALAWGQAGMANLHYGFLDRIAEESVPWSATEERMVAWAALKGVTAKAATPASGLAAFTGTSGASLASGSSVTLQDGTAYVTTAIGTVASGAVTVPIVATVPGALGNADAGTTLTLGSGAPGINATGIAVTALTGGADAEAPADLRTRMLLQYAAPPQGGAGTDYVEWALAVPGVTRAWVAGSAAVGTVTVYTMRDATSGFPVGSDGVAAAETRDIAATGDQLAVANGIYPLRPVTALVYSRAPATYAVNVVIGNLYPDTTAVRAAISAALAAAILRDGSVGGTSWPVASAGVQNGYLFPSSLSGAMSAIPGLVRYTLVAPTSAVVAPAGALHVLGTVTYV